MRFSFFIERRIIYLLSMGIIIGTVVGFILSAYSITANRYIQYEMYRLAAFVFQKNINYSIFFSIVGVIGFYLLLFLLIKKMKLDKVKVIHFFEIVMAISIVTIAVDWLIRELTDLTLIYGLKDLLRMISVYFNYKISLKELFGTIIEQLKYFIMLSCCGIVVIPFFYWLIKKFPSDNISEFIQKKHIVKTAFLFCGLLIIVNLGIIVEKRKDAKEEPNVIFVVIDALRADHVSSYGYKRPTTPNIDRLSRDGILFKKAFSQGNRTTISMPSMFTGLYPSDPGHYVFRNLEHRYAPLNNRFTTLTEILKNANYVTQAVSCQPWISPDSGFGQGFDRFEIISGALDNLCDKKTMQRALEWLDKNSNKKFFLFLNLMGPHTPYNPPKPYDKIYTSKNNDNSKWISDLNNSLLQDRHDEYYRILMNRTKENTTKEELNQLMALYDGKITFTDVQIGYLVDKLRLLKIYDNTLIILTADHGEAFLEHNKLLHGNYIYNEEIHVPLIMTYPNKIPKGKTVNSVVELVDILPTITNMIGIHIDRIKMRGISLYPLEGNSNYSNPYAYSEGSFSIKEGRGFTKYMNDKWSLICDNSDWRCELYDLENDPKEEKDLAKSEPEIALGLKDELFELINVQMYPSLQKVKTIRIPEKTKERLRSLGYLQ
ncbi:MAG: sulfatase-like hydrolase/transferase [Thermodesulfobacteriota bacterium]|nr:sulfatase-like hydrolase/transferase [Thermodesulfobacteriota bacterium]